MQIIFGTISLFMEAQYNAKVPAQSLPSIKPSNLYVDLPGYLSPSILTAESLTPDTLLSIDNKCLYIIELTVSFESNLERNSQRKEIQYRPLLKYFENTYRKVSLLAYQKVLLVYLVKHLNHFLRCVKS